MSATIDRLVNILEVVYTRRRVGVTRLAKETGLHYLTVWKNVKLLTEINLIVEDQYKGVIVIKPISGKKFKDIKVVDILPALNKHYGFVDTIARKENLTLDKIKPNEYSESAIIGLPALNRAINTLMAIKAEGKLTAERMAERAGITYEKFKPIIAGLVNGGLIVPQNGSYIIPVHTVKLQHLTDQFDTNSNCINKLRDKKLW